MKKKKSNMFMMEADVFHKTPLSKKAEEHGIEVNGVPTVLYVSPDGNVREASDIRNESAMTNIIMTGKPDADTLVSLPPLSETLAEMSKEPENMGENVEVQAMIPPAVSSEEPDLDLDLDSDSDSESEAEPEAEPEAEAELIANANANAITNVTPNLFPPPIQTKDMITPTPSSSFKSILPGVSVVQDNLHALPASTISTTSNTKTVVQSGGSPWAAFLSSVAPAATLLGAYALLPKKNQRSSGLKRVSRRMKKMTRASKA
jgi:hypothetical protein